MGTLQNAESWTDEGRARRLGHHQATVEILHEKLSNLIVDARFLKKSEIVKSLSRILEVSGKQVEMNRRDDEKIEAWRKDLEERRAERRSGQAVTQEAVQS
ncbi:hypothetical protein [Ferrovibrio xuzhouensis]|uniref:Uncharacterized protein n=1 Tax=Ferrovibrio xuzhouensis TaxID=1576914 RepID=A0ABV7VB58_9PROT